MWATLPATLPLVVPQLWAPGYLGVPALMWAFGLSFLAALFHRHLGRRAPQSLGGKAPLGRPKILVLCGPPASGKGTQAELLRDRAQLVHICVGDILRENVEVADILRQGQLVSSDLVNALVWDRLQAPDVQARGAILDGFPRQADQARFLCQLPADIHVFFFETDVGLIKSRALGRRIDPVTNTLYNVPHNLPSDPQILQRLVTREDDLDEQVLMDRLQIYETKKREIYEILSQSLGASRIHQVDGGLDKFLLFEEVGAYALPEAP